MNYQFIANKVFVRLDPGEEIIEKITELAKAQQITLATVSGLGAINAFTVGVFHPKDKQYDSNQFTGDFEIVSLTGTVTTMNGAPYIHFHLSAGDETGAVFGGHLNQAVVSATCEIVLDIIDGTVERLYSPDINLNLFHFVPQA